MNNQKLSEDMILKNPAIGGKWEDLEKEFFTPEEIAESELKAELMAGLLKMRKEKGMTQKKIEELSGVRQPVIARMESGKISPQIDTMIKVLAAMGKKLAIVPMDYQPTA